MVSGCWASSLTATLKSMAREGVCRYRCRYKYGHVDEDIDTDVDMDMSILDGRGMALDINYILPERRLPNPS